MTNNKVVRVMVSCGSGIATSMLVASRLRTYLESKGLEISINSCSVNELPYRTQGIDIIVSSAQVPFDTGIPVFNAIPILTGIGDKELLMKIEDKVRELSNTY